MPEKWVHNKIGFIAQAIGWNKSKKLTRFMAPAAHKIRGEVWMKNNIHGFTDRQLLYNIKLIAPHLRVHELKKKGRSSPPRQAQNLGTISFQWLLAHPYKNLWSVHITHDLWSVQMLCKDSSMPMRVTIISNVQCGASHYHILAFSKWSTYFAWQLAMLPSHSYEPKI